LEYKVYFQHYVFKIPALGISVNLFLTVMKVFSKKMAQFLITGEYTAILIF